MGLGWSRGRAARCSGADQYLRLSGSSFTHRSSGDINVSGASPPTLCSAGSGEDGEQAAWADLCFLAGSFTMSGILRSPNTGRPAAFQMLFMAR